MKLLDFQDTSAQRIYTQYMSRLEKGCRRLSREDRNDLLMEFNSHIFEGFQESQNKEEVAKLLDVLENLGNPDEILRPLVADKKLRQASRTFRPDQVFQAIFLKARDSILILVLGILYLSLFVFLLLIPAKIIAPDQTGLFLQGDQFAAFGIISGTEQYREVLGFWLIPLVLACSVLFYIGITMLLRLWRK